MNTNSKSILLVFFFLATAIIGHNAHASTPITGEMAQKYYQQCLVNSQQDGTMTVDSQKSFCTCTAQHMQKNMIVEELVAMKGQDQAARNAINKVITDVNGPCMHIPLHDKVYGKCMTEVKKHAICKCLASGISESLSSQTQGMMKNILATNPNIYDPMGELMNTSEYKNAEKQITYGCAASSGF